MCSITLWLRLDNITCSTFFRIYSHIHPSLPTPDLEQDLHQRVLSYIQHHLLLFIHYRIVNTMHLLENLRN